jgi:hypothetical protein
VRGSGGLLAAVLRACAWGGCFQLGAAACWQEWIDASHWRAPLSTMAAVARLRLSGNAFAVDAMTWVLWHHHPAVKVRGRPVHLLIPSSPCYAPVAIVRSEADPTATLPPSAILLRYDVFEL